MRNLCCGKDDNVLERVVKVMCDHADDRAASYYIWFKIRDDAGVWLVKIHYPHDTVTIAQVA